MPLTVSHALSATTPDDPNYEIQVKHWNSSHAFTLNAVGSEISGAFNNGGGITFGLETNGSITAAAPAGAPSPVNFSAGAASANLASVVFSNSNGISFGLNGSTITATVKTDYLTTARASNDAIGLNTAKTNVTWTVNSSGLSLDAGAYLTTARASNDAIGLNTALTANGVAWTVNSSGLSLNVPAFLTTARASTDAIGLNTAKTNVTWTVNSSGLSIDAGGYAGTGFTSTTTAGTDVKATNNTAGLSMAVPAYLTTAQPVGNYLTTAALSTMGLYASSNTYLTSSGTHDARSLSFRGDKNITVGISASEVVFSVGNYLTTARGSSDAIGLNTAQTNVTWTVNSSGLSINAAGYAGTGTSATNASITLNSNGLAISVAAPGAAAENNNINLLGANTAGNTTASGSTIGLSGLNLTLSGTNNSQVVISAPATSSLVGTNGISISTNGSTISVSAQEISVFKNMGALTTLGTAQANSLVSIQPFLLGDPLAFSNVLIPISMNVASAANNSSAYVDISASAVVYSRNVSTLSSIGSFSNSFTQSFSSNTTGLVTGVLALSLTGAGVTLTQGEYYIAVHMSTANSATGGANTTAIANTISMVLAENFASAANLVKVWGAQTAASQGLIGGLGILSTGATRATIGFSDYVATGSRALLAPVAFELRNQTWWG